MCFGQNYWCYLLYFNVYDQVTTWWIISRFCLCLYSGRRRLFSRWILSKIMKNQIIYVFVLFIAAAGAFFPANIVKKHEFYETSCMYVSTQVDFRSLFLKFREIKSHKNSFVSSGEFQVILTFQISDCLTIFQGYGPGHRFIETLPYIYLYITGVPGARALG